MIRFVEETHQYFDGEVELPSVTDIIRFCHYDTANNANQGTNPFYRDRGTRIHELCFDLDADGEAPQGTGYDGYIAAYSAFLRDYRIKDWLMMETPIGSAYDGYAGTPDRVGYIDGHIAIVDFKTSSRLNKPALSAQLTGYAQLLRGAYGMGIKTLAGLRLGKDGKYQFAIVPEDNELWNACMVLHKRFAKETKQ